MTTPKEPSPEAMAAAREFFPGDTAVTANLARALDAFAEAARKDEREACADIAEDVAMAERVVVHFAATGRALTDTGQAAKIARTIRQRGAP